MPLLWIAAAEFVIGCFGRFHDVAPQFPISLSVSNNLLSIFLG